MPLRATRTIGTGDGWDLTDRGIYVPDWAPYALYQQPEHLERATRRARRRPRLDELARQVNLRLPFRTGEDGAAARLRRASDLLDSEHPRSSRRGEGGVCGRQARGTARRGASGCSPAVIRAARTGVTAPPAAPRNGGGCRRRPDAANRVYDCARSVNEICLRQ